MILPSLADVVVFLIGIGMAGALALFVVDSVAEIRKKERDL